MRPSPSQTFLTTNLRPIMTASRSLTLDFVNNLDRPRFVDALGGVFEHSAWVAEATWAARPFASLAQLHASMVAVVESSSPGRQVALLNAHPALAGREAQAGTMTESSTREQARAGLDALDASEVARMNRLNEAYRARHGFPFIACVAHYTKDGILFEMERRLSNDTPVELRNALAQIYAITRLRLQRLVADAPVVRAEAQAV